MDLQFGKRTSLYFQLLTVLFIGSLLTITGYFWKVGFFNNSSLNNLVRSEELIEKLSEEKIDKQISNAFKKKDFKKLSTSISKLDHTNQKILKVIGENNQVFSDISNLSKDIGNFVNKHNIEKVYEVLNQKVERFLVYVEFNRWPTLSRNTAYLKRIVNSNDFFPSINENLVKIKNTLKHMEDVTLGSVLKEQEKNNIVSRLKEFGPEVTLLVNYQQDLAGIDKKLKVIENYNDFIKTNLGPKLVLERIKINQNGNNFLSLILALLGLMIIGLFVGFIIEKIDVKKQHHQFEDIMKSIIDNKIIKNDDKLNLKTSEKFNRYINIASEYVKKRMRFGSIFQSSLPFPSLLLDSNLRSTWANNHFFDLFSIKESEIYNNHLTWDYLSKLTDIDENDPIYEAIQNNVAGIYQIKVKNASAKLSPFEMYVSPTKIENENFIMILFYPLVNLEETIKDQAAAITKPIENLLDNIIEQKLDQDKFDKFKNIFEIATIESIFYKIVTLNKNFSKKILDGDKTQGVLSEQLNSIQEKFQVIDEITKGGENLYFHQRDLMFNTKEVIINYGQTLDSYVSKINDLYNQLHIIHEALKSEGKTNKDISNIANEIITLSPHFEFLRNESKTLRNEISDQRHKLGHSLGQLIHVKKKMKEQSLIEKFEDQFKKITDDYGYLTNLSDTFDKKMQNFEVFISKTQMLFQTLESKLMKMGTEKNADYTNYLENSGLNKKAIDHLNEKARQTEDDLVEIVKGVYQYVEESGKGYQKLNDIMNVVQYHLVAVDHKNIKRDNSISQ